MTALYSLLIIMLTTAISMLVFPLLKNKNKKWLFIFSVFMISLSCVLYQFSGNKKALSMWLSQGKKHYQLQEQFNELGGLDGAISRIEKKIATDPSDKQGRLILEKLYRVKNETTYTNNP